MAARFHHPPRPIRTGTPRLRIVPLALAPVLPMPRPAARPGRLVVLSCPRCGLITDPTPRAEAEQDAGTHDDQHHDGRPTAELRTVHTLGPARALRARAAAGPDLGGAA